MISEGALVVVSNSSAAPRERQLVCITRDEGGNAARSEVARSARGPVGTVAKRQAAGHYTRIVGNSAHETPRITYAEAHGEGSTAASELFTREVRNPKGEGSASPPESAQSLTPGAGSASPRNSAARTRSAASGSARAIALPGSLLNVLAIRLQNSSESCKLAASKSYAEMAESSSLESGTGGNSISIRRLPSASAASVAPTACSLRRGHGAGGMPG